MKIIYAESDFWDKNKDFTEKYENTIVKTYKKAKKLISFIPEEVTFVCQTNNWECIKETGDGGFTRSSRLLLLSMDPSMPYDEKVFLKNVESTVLHELNHSARYEQGIMHGKFLDNCIMEGLATVFEREYSERGKPLWADYDSSVIKSWFKEIVSVTKKSFSWRDYMYRHPDGRRWMGYKVGTWIVDEAIINSGKNIEELTLCTNEEILDLAKLS